ncbi:hypothetical protein niasHT_007511 [Heterodera trifolii]|uniref:Fatty-acid and retinol-binding protein 1 n=1 Tax=Heterodera trifolii TaxID=157864 RepID=A0ABD2LPE0_9BILA
MLLLLSIFSLFLPLFLTFSPFANAFPALSQKTTETATNYNANDPLRSLPPELDMGRVKEVVPEEAADFFDQLTGRDKQVLREVLAKADTYQSTGEVLQDLRNGSSTLYDKAVQVVTSVRGIVAKLSVPARTFVDESVEQLRNAFGGGFSLSNLKAQAQQLVVRYRQLDASTKEELRNAFPTIVFVLDNPVVQTMASGLFDIKTKDEAGEGPMGERGRERNGEGEREGEEGDRDNGGMTRGGGRGEDRGGRGGVEVEDEVGERAERRNVIHRRKNRSAVSVASMAAATSAAAVATNIAMSTMINQQRRSDLGRREG